MAHVLDTATLSSHRAARNESRGGKTIEERKSNPRPLRRRAHEPDGSNRDYLASSSHLRVSLVAQSHPELSQPRLHELLPLEAPGRTY